MDGPQAPYVKKGKPIKDLIAVVDHVKPTVLMGRIGWTKKSDTERLWIFVGASGVGRLFHEAILKKMAQINERPVIFALYVGVV